MCGIVGKLSGHRPIPPDLVDAMCGVIGHRGPDSRGTYLGEGVGLGVQRLAIIDLQTGDQPIFNEGRTVVVVLNGEIYNYRELRDDLRRRGHRFSSTSDTEVIVHLYEEMGDRCVEQLRGMFAFAVWDIAARRLLLARDRIGKKPLFYATQGDTLWFASEAKAILQDPDVSREPSLDAIDCFLQLQYVPDPLSAFAMLRKLPPAHVLTWQDGDVRLERYWELSYRDRQPRPQPEEMHERIRAELLDATRLRLRADVPLGGFLSGGVDSSAVVAAMAMQSSGRVKTFSVGFDVAAFDETAHAREVATLFDTDHHEFRVDPDAMEILPRLVWHYGEPFADPSAIPSFHLAEVASRHVTVALNGDGGDEDFAGYPRYVAHLLAQRLDWIPTGLSRLAAAGLDRIRSGPSASSLRARLRRMAHALTMEPYERYAMWIAYFNERERRELYTPELQRELGERSARSVIRDPFLASDATTLLDRLLDTDVQTFLPGALLVKMDIASMAHSLEVRSPLLDHRFMEMAAGLPADVKLHGRVTKKVFKDALRPWLPDHLLDRAKMGFTVPLSAWFRGPLRDLPAGVLLDPRARERGLFREDAVRRIIDDHMAGRRDNGTKIWALLQHELWLRTYVDPVIPRPVVLPGL